MRPPTDSRCKSGDAAGPPCRSRPARYRSPCGVRSSLLRHRRGAGFSRPTHIRPVSIRIVGARPDFGRVPEAVASITPPFVLPDIGHFVIEILHEVRAAAAAVGENARPEPRRYDKLGISVGEPQTVIPPPVADCFEFHPDFLPIFSIVHAANRKSNPQSQRKSKNFAGCRGK